MTSERQCLESAWTYSSSSG